MSAVGGWVWSCVFSKLDLHAGFFQIPLHPNSRALTSFWWGNTLYRFTRAPFGIKVCPGRGANERQAHRAHGCAHGNWLRLVGGEDDLDLGLGLGLRQNVMGCCVLGAPYRYQHASNPKREPCCNPALVRPCMHVQEDGSEDSDFVIREDGVVRPLKHICQTLNLEPCMNPRAACRRRASRAMRTATL